MELKGWQELEEMAEGVRLSGRLRNDLDIVKQYMSVHKTREKESWAGIAPMLIGNLEPNR